MQLQHLLSLHLELFYLQRCNNALVNKETYYNHLVVVFALFLVYFVLGFQFDHSPARVHINLYFSKFRGMCAFTVISAYLC